MIIIVTLIILLSVMPCFAEKPHNPGRNFCAQISDGIIYQEDDMTPILPGVDEWGYNFEKHSFEGKYCDSYHNADWCKEWADEDLKMRWNDAWLSNEDCDYDGNLDRPSEWVGSGAWLVMFRSGSYIDESGVLHQWSRHLRVQAIPEGAYLEEGIWYGKNGQKLGNKYFSPEWGYVLMITIDTYTEH